MTQPTTQMLASLKKKLFALRISSDDLENAYKQLQDVLGDYLESKQKSALQQWRAATKGWGIAAPETYRYLRNKPSPKALCLKTENGVTASACQYGSRAEQVLDKNRKLAFIVAQRESVILGGG